MDVYVKSEGVDTGDTYIKATYPDGSTRLLVATNADDEAYGNISKLTAQIPIGAGQTDISFEIALNAAGETEARMEIFGCETYVPNNNAGAVWEVEEVRAQGVTGSQLNNDEWTTLPFNSDIGVNQLEGCSQVDGEFTFAPGKYQITLMTNIRTAAQLSEKAGMRVVDADTSAVLQTLPNINPGYAVDYWGSGHSMSNSQTGVFDLSFSVPTTWRIEVYPDCDMYTGEAMDKAAIGEEHYSRLRVVGGADAVPSAQPTSRVAECLISDIDDLGAGTVGPVTPTKVTNVVTVTRGITSGVTYYDIVFATAADNADYFIMYNIYNNGNQLTGVAQVSFDAAEKSTLGFRISLAETDGWGQDIDAVHLIVVDPSKM